MIAELSFLFLLCSFSLILLQGHVKPGAAAEIARRLFDMGCYEVSMGDTIGVGTPASVAEMFKVCCCGTILPDDAAKRYVMQDCFSGTEQHCIACTPSAVSLDDLSRSMVG